MKSVLCLFALLALAAAQADADMTEEERLAAARARMGGDVATTERDTEGAKELIQEIADEIIQTNVTMQATYIQLKNDSRVAKETYRDTCTRCEGLYISSNNLCAIYDGTQAALVLKRELHANNTAARNRELDTIEKLMVAVNKLEAIRGGRRDLQDGKIDSDALIDLLQTEREGTETAITDIVATLLHSSDDSSNIKGFLESLKTEIEDEQTVEEQEVADLTAQRDTDYNNCEVEKGRLRSCLEDEAQDKTTAIAAVAAFDLHNRTWLEYLPVYAEEYDLVLAVKDKLAEFDQIRNLALMDADLELHRAFSAGDRIKNVMDDIIRQIQDDSEVQRQQMEGAIETYNTKKNIHEDAVDAHAAAVTQRSNFEELIATATTDKTTYHGTYTQREAMRAKEMALIDKLAVFAQKLDQVTELSTTMLTETELHAAVMNLLASKEIPAEDSNAIHQAIADLRRAVNTEAALELLELNKLIAKIQCLNNGQSTDGVYPCGPARTCVGGVDCTDVLEHLEWAQGVEQDALQASNFAKDEMDSAFTTKWDWIVVFGDEERTRAKEIEALEDVKDLVDQILNANTGPPTPTPPPTPLDPTLSAGDRAALAANDDREGRRQLAGEPTYFIQLDAEARLFGLAENRNTSAKVLAMLNELRAGIQQEQRDDDQFVINSNNTKNEYSQVEREKRDVMNTKINQASVAYTNWQDGIGFEAAALQALTDNNRTRELEALDIMHMKEVVANLTAVEEVPASDVVVPGRRRLAALQELSTERFNLINAMEIGEFSKMISAAGGQMDLQRMYDAAQTINRVLDGVLIQRHQEMIDDIALHNQKQQDTRDLDAINVEKAADASVAISEHTTANDNKAEKVAEFNSAVANNRAMTPQRAHEIILIDTMIIKIVEFQSKKGVLEDLQRITAGSRKIRKYLNDMKEFLIDEDAQQLAAIDDAETKFNDAQSARGSAVEALANAQGIADTKDIEFNTAAGELLAGQEALAAANEVRANETAVVNEIRDLLKELNYAALDEGETQTVTVIGDQSTAIIKDTTKGRGIYIAGTYTLEFRLKLTGTLDTWGNIILYGDDTENERAPAVFTVPGTTKLAFQHNSVEGGANTGVEPEDPLTVDTQYNIKMRVVEEDGSDEQNTMKVYYNNMAVPVGELTVQKFTFFAHKNFWVSDPDHDAALGEISNLKLTAGRPLSCTPSCVPETTANLATKKDRSFDTHPVFGPILLQIRHQHQHKHKVRPEAQRKIHAALDKLVGKLQDEQEKEETEVARLQSVNDQSNSQLVDSQGVLTTRNTELTDRESELAAARSYLAECRDTFNTDDPVRDEEIEVLDDVLAILDQFEGIANTDQSEYNNMRNYGDPTQLTDGVNAMGNTGLMYR